jgi:hypothetical protein
VVVVEDNIEVVVDKVVHKLVVALLVDYKLVEVAFDNLVDHMMVECY